MFAVFFFLGDLWHAFAAFLTGEPRLQIIFRNRNSVPIFFSLWCVHARQRMSLARSHQANGRSSRCQNARVRCVVVSGLRGLCIQFVG